MSTPVVSIRFSIVGEEFDPNDITKSLGITPTAQNSHHRIYCPKTQQYRNESYWSIETQKAKTWDIACFLASLIERLAPYKDEIIKVSKQLNARIMVVVNLDLNGTNGPGMCLGPETLRFLADIGASYDVDICV